jgi:hypothetical protein
VGVKPEGTAEKVTGVPVTPVAGLESATLAPPPQFGGHPVLAVAVYEYALIAPPEAGTSIFKKQLDVQAAGEKLTGPAPGAVPSEASPVVEVVDPLLDCQNDDPGWVTPPGRFSPSER